MPSLLVSPAAAQSESAFVPWPDSVRLLDIIAGDQTVALPAPIDRCGARLAIPDGRTFELLSTLQAGLGEIFRHLIAMRRISTLVAWGDERVALERRFQRRKGRIQQVVAEAWFDGLSVLDSDLEVCLESVQYVLPLPIATPTGLGIQALGVGTISRAQAAIDPLDTAIDHVACLILDSRLGARSLDDGPPDGGLREQRRILRRARGLAIAAANATIGTGERFKLQHALERELERVEDVARHARFRGYALLSGEMVLELQAAPQRGSVRPYTVPDRTVQGLGLSALNIETARNALGAITSLQAAIDIVTSDLRAAKALRRRLRSPPITPKRILPSPPHQGR